MIGPAFRRWARRTTRPMPMPPADLDQRLSPHFTLREMVRSQIATRLDIPNAPAPRHVEALRAVCTHVLEPVRAHFERPVVVSSGYRSPVLNRRVGGSASSQHMSGQAVDFEVMGVSNRTVWEWIDATLDYDQLILELYEDGDPFSGWVHVSHVAPALNRRETLRVLR